MRHFCRWLFRCCTVSGSAMPAGTRARICSSVALGDASCSPPAASTAALNSACSSAVHRSRALKGRAAAAAAAAARMRPSLAAGSTGEATAAAAAGSASPDGASSCSAADLPDTAPAVEGASHQNGGRDQRQGAAKRAFVVASLWRSLLRPAGRRSAAHAREDGGQLALDHFLGLVACGRRASVLRDVLMCVRGTICAGLWARLGDAPALPRVARPRGSATVARSARRRRRAWRPAACLRRAAPAAARLRWRRQRTWRCAAPAPRRGCRCLPAA